MKKFNLFKITAGSIKFLFIFILFEALLSSHISLAKVSVDCPCQSSCFLNDNSIVKGLCSISKNKGEKYPSSCRQYIATHNIRIGQGIHREKWTRSCSLSEKLENLSLNSSTNKTEKKLASVVINDDNTLTIGSFYYKEGRLRVRMTHNTGPRKVQVESKYTIIQANVKKEYFLNFIAEMDRRPIEFDPCSIYRELINDKTQENFILINEKWLNSNNFYDPKNFILLEFYLENGKCTHVHKSRGAMVVLNLPQKISLELDLAIEGAFQAINIANRRKGLSRYEENRLIYHPIQQLLSKVNKRFFIRSPREISLSGSTTDIFSEKQQKLERELKEMEEKLEAMGEKSTIKKKALINRIKKARKALE